MTNAKSITILGDDTVGYGPYEYGGCVYRNYRDMRLDEFWDVARERELTDAEKNEMRSLLDQEEEEAQRADAHEAMR